MYSSQAEAGAVPSKAATVMKAGTRMVFSRLFRRKHSTTLVFRHGLACPAWSRRARRSGLSDLRSYLPISGKPEIGVRAFAHRTEAGFAMDGAKRQAAANSFRLLLAAIAV